MNKFMEPIKEVKVPGSRLDTRNTAAKMNTADLRKAKDTLRRIRISYGGRKKWVDAAFAEVIEVIDSHIDKHFNAER